MCLRLELGVAQPLLCNTPFAEREGRVSAREKGVSAWKFVSVSNSTITSFAIHLSQRERGVFAQENGRVCVRVSFGYLCAQERVNLEEKYEVAQRRLEPHLL